LKKTVKFIDEDDDSQIDYYQGSLVSPLNFLKSNAEQRKTEIVKIDNLLSEFSVQDNFYNTSNG